MRRTHAGHGSIWPAKAVEARASDQSTLSPKRIAELRALLAKAEDAAARMAQNKSSLTDLITFRSIVNAIPALLDAAERASRAREDALREAIEICKEADAQDDRDNGAAATGAACNAANAILALIDKPKGGDRG